MKCGGKILGLLLSAVIIAAPLAAPLATKAWAEPDTAGASSSGFPAGGTEHPAGCHAHAGKTLPHSQPPRPQLPHSPRPTPVSYQCCLTGHDVAVVQAFLSPQPSIQCTRVTLRLDPASISLLDELEVSALLSADPPGTTPLRI
jgi:hypothetical protein